MKTRYKILILLFAVTLVVGALAFWYARGDSDAVVRLRSLFFGSTVYDLKRTLTTVPDKASLWYGGISLFAIAMAVLAFRGGRRDGPGSRERLIELKPAKAQAGKLLHDRLLNQSHARYSTDPALERRIRALESEVRNKEELLQRRDEELESLRSRVAILADPPGEGGTVKAEVEGVLREELERVTELLRAKESAAIELAISLTVVQELAQRRSQELDALQSGVTSLTQQLADLSRTKEHAEHALQQELKKTKSLQAKEAIISELESSLAGQQEFLQSRSRELDAVKAEMNHLREQLADLKLAKEQAENALQQELKKTKALQASIVEEQENGLSEKVQALESELGEKQELLQTRSKELKAANSKVNSLRERLSAAGSAKKQAENVLQQQLKQKGELLESKEAALKELQESLGTRVDALEIALKEKDKLLNEREAELQVLGSEVNSLTESGSARERAKSLLMQELQGRTELLQASDAMVKELQERLRTTVHALENAQSEVERLVRQRDVELTVNQQPSKAGPAKSRSERKGMNSKLFELGAAKARVATRPADTRGSETEDPTPKEPGEVASRDHDRRGGKGT